MIETVHYSGLTAAEVVERRNKYGNNVLTPPKKETLGEKLRHICTHWIVRMMLVILLLTVVAAGFLTPGMGTITWMMPAVMTLSTLLILTVGLFGGFKDPLFKILIFAFILSIGIAVYEYCWKETGVRTFFEPIGIIVALILATGISFFLERRNEKTFQSLNQAADDTLVKVVREDNVCQIPRRDIVVGDITLLEPGEEIPADCILLHALNLMVNESTLTGEPQCSKTTDTAHFDPEATYPSNHIMKGTVVLEGYCTAEVVRVGDKTECGKVFRAAQVKDGEATPLSDELDELASLITKVSYFFAALIIVGRLVMFLYLSPTDLSAGDGWLDFLSYMVTTIMIAITLIVVAVPEGLPMSVTLSLAFSMRKLMKQHTLPRTIHSCETMGAISVICTDKTGTLTRNQMRVADTRLVDLSEPWLSEMIATNTTANLDFSDSSHVRGVGNPTECALLLWLHERGTDYRKLREESHVVAVLPFSTENKYMAVLVDSLVCGKRMLYVKSAPETLLDFCAVSATERQTYDELLSSYQNRGMRTLALAYTEWDCVEDPFAYGKLSVGQLTFAGIYAISDPVRDDVPAAILDCMHAGIQVKIVTGDSSGTAREIARQIGLWQQADTDWNILTGTQFAAMSDEQLLDRVSDIKILSRARPHDKERFVRLLKRKGCVVAVTGDGTNDAPALNAADVGLSMGDGTAVAKEASDMTIQDNSFATITHAVMWGRSLYRNIQRFLLFQLTVNVTACCLVLLGAFMGTKSPLTVTQMLWINLIMDTFAAIALASLPPLHAVMNDKPRDRRASILTSGMRREIFGVGFLFFVLLAAMLYIFEHGNYDSMTDLFLHPRLGVRDDLTTYEVTLLFTTFVMTHFFYLFNARAFQTGRSALHFCGCQGLIVIAAVIFVGQILMVEVPVLQDFFNVCGLSLQDWLIIVGCSSLVLWIREAWHVFAKKNQYVAS